MSHSWYKKMFKKYSVVAYQLKCVNCFHVESNELMPYLLQRWLSDILNEITSEAVINQQWWTGLSDQKVANDWVWSSNGEKMNVDTEM